MHQSTEELSKSTTLYSSQPIFSRVGNWDHPFYAGDQWDEEGSTFLPYIQYCPKQCFYPEHILPVAAGWDNVVIPIGWVPMIMVLFVVQGAKRILIVIMVRFWQVQDIRFLFNIIMVRIHTTIKSILLLILTLVRVKTIMIFWVIDQILKNAGPELAWMMAAIVHTMVIMLVMVLMAAIIRRVRVHTSGFYNDTWVNVGNWDSIFTHPIQGDGVIRNWRVGVRFRAVRVVHFHQVVVAEVLMLLGKVMVTSDHLAIIRHGHWHMNRTLDIHVRRQAQLTMLLMVKMMQKIWLLMVAG